MKYAEPPKLMGFKYPFSPRIDNSHAERMPLGSMSAKIIEHRPNVNVSLF
jgi:hypothetical protein